MIEIEKGKVYVLKGGGLFEATYRHDIGDEYSHWVMSRITSRNSWEGYFDPIVFDDAQDTVVREANHKDYTDYRSRYRREIGSLREQEAEYQGIIDELFDAENRNGGRVGGANTESVHEGS